MGFNFGGLFSSESKSSSSSQSTSTTNTDSRMVNDGGAIGLNSANSTNSTVNIFSQGLEGGAFDLAANSLAALGIVANSTVDGMGTNASNAMAAQGVTANTAMNLVEDTAYNAMYGMGFTAVKAMAENASLAKSVAEAGQSIVSAASQTVAAQGARNSEDFRSILGATSNLANQAYGALATNVTLARELNSASMSAYESASQQASGNKNIVLAGMAVVALAVVMMWGNK